MVKLRPTTIFLSGEIDRGYEGNATAAITPGMLVEIVGPDGTPVTPGRNKDIAPHGTAGGVGSMFAREMDLTGSSIDDDYEVGDTVLYQTCRAGDRVFALVPAAAAAITAGDLLQSNGDGTLVIVPAVDGGTAVAVALEDIDNSAGADVARIKVEVL